MNFLTKTMILVGALALAGCESGPGRFGKNGAGGGAGAGTGGVIEGSANDPKSPAYFQQTIGDRVLFEVDQAVLNEAAKQVLNGQASWLTTNADYAVVIEGHADEQGTRGYNLALGARRANAVREYLLSRGIAAARLKTVSYGKERPIEVCSEEGCYSKNRRAVTVLSLGVGS